MKLLKKSLRLVLSVLLILILATAGYAATQIDFSNPADLTEYLRVKYQKAGIPGMAVTLIKDDEVVYFNGFGAADIADGKPITQDTVFQVASVSKTVTGTAVMQLYERGLLDLDQDISDYLPFEVKNPNFPQADITARMLLTHTSSVLDDWDVLDPLYTTYTGGGDSTVPLGEFLPEYLTREGRWYHPENSFSSREPGARYRYSNVGYALLGYLVEVISQQDFNVFCRENIFVPLKMEHTGWFLSEVDTDLMAKPYEKGEKGFIELPFYGFPTYPDGCLKTSSRDYARFLMAFLNKGEYEGRRILEEKTVNEMLQYQVPKKRQGLTWDLRAPEAFLLDCKGQLAPGHSGGDPGVTTLTFFLPEQRTGVILFMNQTTGLEFKAANIWQIAGRLLQEAQAKERTP